MKYGMMKQENLLNTLIILAMVAVVVVLATGQVLGRVEVTLVRC